MIRSLIVIVLAIVCGAAAAVGVNQLIRRNKPAADIGVETRTVICASQPVARGDVVTEDLLKEVPWPTTLVPAGVFGSKQDVAGRTAKETIMPGEPIFAVMVTGKDGSGFVASIVKPAMRAYTIQTKGASSSVAGFIRPRDHVDVLLHLRGSTNDETGGGSTTTLLQNVEVLAIDRILDSNLDTMQQKLEMWAKGDSFASVTLLVKPEEATRLFLGQSSGELSLALRNANDSEPIENPTVTTIKQIRYQEGAVESATNGDAQSDSAGGNKPPAPFPNVPVADAIPGQKRAPDAYIHTIRGDQVGRVPVAVNR